MPKKLPKVENMLAFLKSKGWKFQGKSENQLYFIFLPPEDIEFREQFLYPVPVHEHFSDYEKVITNMVEGLSELYEMDFTELFNLLSQSRKEIKEGIAHRKALLAQAA